MNKIKTFGDFINEARKPGDPVGDMYDKLKDALQLLQNAKGKIDNIIGLMNDTMELSDIKKNKSYKLLIDYDKQIGVIKDKLSNLDLEK